MNILQHPDPAQLSGTANTSDVLAALRKIGADDKWTERSLQTLDHLLVTWTTRVAARYDDIAGIAELRHLIDYAISRCANRQHLPAASRSRWEALRDVLESRRHAIEGREPETVACQPHVNTIISLIGQGITLPDLTKKLQDIDIRIGRGGLNQLLSLMEAHQLIYWESRIKISLAGRDALDRAGLQT